jgi:tetratricopeptide (TPR) repeat protein
MKKKIVYFSIIAFTALFISSAYCETAEEYFNRGVSLGRQGKHDAAIAEFEKSAKLAPQNAQIYFNIGYTYEGKRDADKAIAYYSKAIGINPRHINAYKRRAAMYWYLRQYDKSWSDVNEVKTLGGTFDSGFLEDLKRDSGRDK